MTLAEWVGRLPEFHAAHREYDALMERVNALATPVAAPREAEYWCVMYGENEQTGDLFNFEDEAREHANELNTKYPDAPPHVVVRLVAPTLEAFPATPPASREPEPVAWAVYGDDLMMALFQRRERAEQYLNDHAGNFADGDLWRVIPLYTRPPQGVTELQQHIGLHEVVEIHYLVDCYEAVLLTRDGDALVARGTGDSVADALDRLTAALRASESP